MSYVFQQCTPLSSPELDAVGVPLCGLHYSFCCGRLTIVGGLVDLVVSWSMLVARPCLVRGLLPLAGGARSQGFMLQDPSEPHNLFWLTGGQR